MESIGGCNGETVVQRMVTEDSTFNERQHGTIIAATVTSVPAVADLIELYLGRNWNSCLSPWPSLMASKEQQVLSSSEDKVHLYMYYIRRVDPVADYGGQTNRCRAHVFF